MQGGALSRQRRAQSQVLFLSSSLFLSYTSPSLLRRLAQTPSVASISSVASNTEVLGCRGANLAWLRESISLGALFRDFLLNGSLLVEVALRAQPLNATTS